MEINLKIKRDNHNTYPKGNLSITFDDDFVQITVYDRQISIEKEGFLQAAQAIHLTSKKDFSIFDALIGSKSGGGE